MYPLGLILVAASAGFSQGTPARVIDPIWLDKVRSEVPGGYEKYVAASKQVEERSVAAYRQDQATGRSKSPFRPRTIHVTAARLGDNMWSETAIVFDDDKDKPIIRLDCVNHQYRFTLRKASLGSPYVLSDYDLVKPGEPVGGATLHTYAFADLRKLIEVISGDDQRALKTVQWLEMRQVVYVRFTTPVGGKSSATMDQEFWLDPNADWRIVEIRKTQPSNHTHVLISYGHAVGGVTFPERIVETTKDPAGIRPSFQIDTTLNVWKTDKAPDDFRLSAFGLPEPVEFAEAGGGRIPTFVYVLAAAGACAILAGGFRYISRRNDTRPAATTPAHET